MPSVHAAHIGDGGCTGGLRQAGICQASIRSLLPRGVRQIPLGRTAKHADLPGAIVTLQNGPPWDSKSQPYGFYMLSGFPKHWPPGVSAVRVLCAAVGCCRDTWKLAGRPEIHQETQHGSDSSRVVGLQRRGPGSGPDFLTREGLLPSQPEQGDENNSAGSLSGPHSPPVPAPCSVILECALRHRTEAG